MLSDGPTRTTDSQIVGEVGGPDVDIAIAPYPSDHRALVSTFAVRAGEPPVLVAVSSRRVFVGEDLRVTFHSPGQVGERLALVRLRDGERSEVGQVIAERPTAEHGASDGQVRFATGALRPGQYQARLLDRNGRILSRTPFWLYSPGTPTTVNGVDKRYRVGEAIHAQVHNAPGRGLDWLAVFRCDNSGCAGNGDYLLYSYTDAAVEGEVTIDAHSIAGTQGWPLPAGRYVLRLLTDDSYEDIATSQEFTIAAH